MKNKKLNDFLVPTENFKEFANQHVISYVGFNTKDKFKVLWEKIKESYIKSEFFVVIDNYKGLQEHYFFKNKKEAKDKISEFDLTCLKILIYDIKNDRAAACEFY